MVTVAITGVGGLIGRRLCRALERDEHVDDILGLDLRPPDDLASPSVRFVAADVRDPRLVEQLDGVDVLVHLAFQVDPIRDEAAMRTVNVEGTRNVVASAHAAGVGKIVYVSSGVAYGAHPDNDFPLTEDSPLRANDGFSYAQHKLEVEQWLWPWAQDHPETLVTVLRPSIVAGPGVENFISRQLELPRLPIVRGHRPPWQFAHVDDVASALAHVVATDLPGAYNVTSEGWLAFDEAVAICGRKVLELPEEIAFSTAERLWLLGLGDAPPGQVNYIMHPWVLDVDKLAATGWQPRYSNRDALVELVAEHADVVNLGGMRMRRSRLRVAGAGLAGAAVLGGLARRSRRRRRRSHVGG